MSDYRTLLFRPVTLNDKAWMDRCRKEGANDMTVLSFPAVFTWQSAFGLTIAGDEHFYIVKSEADQGYYYPVGEESACRNCVRSLLQASLDNSPCISSRGFLKFVYVPEKELGWLEDLGFTITNAPDTSEYVYSSRSLALLDNGSGTNYRVKIRHFSRDNDWTAQPFSFPEDTEMLRKMTADWDNSLDNHISEDRLATLACAENPAALGLSGIHVHTQDGEWAFLLGYPSTDRIYDMTVVKYSPHISRNVVPVCICEMAKQICDTFPYTNFEDDLGILGLRNMKKLYRPLFLLDSYTASLSLSLNISAS